MPAIDPASLNASLRRLGAVGDAELRTALDLVVGACVDVFTVTGSGLMIADDEDSLRYVAASDGPGRVMETVQAETGQGPCVDAYVMSTLVTTDDLSREERWPASRATLLAHGIRSVLGVPVRLGGVVVGSLDVYRDRPGEWHDTERAALGRYGEVVEATLYAALRAHRAGELADQLQYALDYRVVIERGVGFLMGREGLDAVAAFDRLRRAARGSRRKVAEVAKELLESGRLPTG